MQRRFSGHVGIQRGRLVYGHPSTCTDILRRPVFVPLFGDQAGHTLRAGQPLMSGILSFLP
jgi:hypothetical protein